MVVLSCFPHILSGQQVNIEDITITITFAGTPSTMPVVNKSVLKYDKRFALILQMDDGNEDIYSKVYPYFRGQQGNQGLFFTDGVGNSIWYKMGAVHFSEDASGNDVHQQDSGYISWDEMNTLWAAFFGIESRGFDNPSNPIYPYYEVNRNISFTKKNTSSFVPGGVNMKVYVVPPNGDGQINKAKQAGNIAIYDNSLAALNNPLRIESVPDFYQKEFSRTRISNNLFNNVQQMANNSVGDNHYIGSYFCNGFDNGTDISFDDFKQQMNQIDSAYGRDGSNTIWSASATEIFEYLVLRNRIAVHENLTDSILKITFTGNDIPIDFRWYSLTLTVKSDTNITDLTVSENSFPTYKYSNDSAIINLNWNGGIVEPDETTAETYIQKAAAVNNLQTCLIAKDYVEMIQNADSLEKYKEELCSICGEDLLGYCSYNFNVPADTICLNDTAILIAPEGMKHYLWSTTDTTQIIKVEPDTITSYWVEVITQKNIVSRDTTQVIVYPLPQFAHSHDTILNDSGHDTLLWVTGGNASYLWSTGVTDTSIIVAPKATHAYYVDVTNSYECIVRQNFLIMAQYNYDVNFSYDTVCFGDTTLLVNTSVSNDSAVSVSWDLNSDGIFGDAFGDIIQYVFGSSGNILIGMRITYASGTLQLAYNTVPVADAPNVWFGYNGICSPNTSTNFSDSSTVLVGNLVSWYWSYGDGIYDIGRYVSHRYGVGSYLVSHTAISSFGCVDSVSRHIQIYGNPEFNLLRKDSTKVYFDDTVYFASGGSAYLLVENATAFDSIIWPDGKNSPDYNLSQEGKQTVTVYQNVCSSFTSYIGAISGGITPYPSNSTKVMNLFTPNGDGYNDYWVINSKDITFPIKVNIYNRFGKLVYRSDNYQNDWNGYYNGNILPKGTYYYIIKDASGNIFKGPVSIIR